MPNLPKLAADIDHAVNPNRGNPKITGPALNKLLHELVAELAVDPAELVAEQTSYLFRVGGPGTSAIAQLSLDQAKLLVENAGTSVTLRTDVTAGHYYDVVVSYDGPNNRFVLERITSDTGSVVTEGWQVGAGNLTSSSITPLSYQQAQAIATIKGTSTFRLGSPYRLTNRPDQALGTAGDVLVMAVGDYELSSDAALLTNVPDYANLPAWFPTTTPLGAPTGETTYTYAVQSSYVRIMPQIDDFVESSLAGDDNFKVVPLPFPFIFGGITYHEVCVDTNGRVVFGPIDNYSSQYVVPALGSQAVPLIAACWTDLMANGRGNVSVFITGKAPYRRLVVDYSQMRYVYDAAYIHNTLDNLKQTYSGQIILEESDGSIAVGQSENAVTAQYPAFGLQYAGHVYQPYPLNTNAPVNTTIRYTPVTMRAPAVPVSYVGGTTAIWKGQTWDFTGTDKTVEPGANAAQWVLHVGPAADQHGNTVRVGDTVVYDLSTDAIRRRTDRHLNEVTGGSCQFFPWGMPGVHDNQVRNTVLDTSLLTTPDLQFAHNVLTDCNLSRLALAGVNFSHNRLDQVTLANYAPASFTGVTAHYGLNPEYKDPSNQYFLHGDLLKESASDLQTALMAFKGKYLDQAATIYKSGETPVAASLNIASPWAQDFTAHDAIELQGVDLTTSFAFTSQNLNIVGNATLGFTRIAYLNTINAPGYTMTFKGLNFARGVSIAAATSYVTSGNNIHLVQCTIASIEANNGGSTAYVSTVTYSQCVINRMTSIGNGPMMHILINNACMGRDVTSGSIFPGPRTSANGPLVITNSTIYLYGTATLFDAGLSPLYYPTFRDCTVVAADGTVTTLNTNIALPAAPTSLTGTRIAGTSVHLNWDINPTAPMYQVYSNVASAGFQLLATIPYPFFDDASTGAITSGVSIQYYIKAANATGPGPASTTITVNS